MKGNFKESTKKQTPVSNKTKRVEYVDHTGKKFCTMKAMCEHWNIHPNTFSNRITKYGWSVEKALTVSAHDRNKCVDHEENRFDTETEMCRYWNIPINIFSNRINRYGWNLKDALTIPVKKRTAKKYTDHEDNTFSSIAEMCRHWGIPTYVFHNRVKKLNWSIEDALTKPVKNGNKCTDHENHTFSSIVEMCKYWGIPIYTFYFRMYNGWDIEKALTMPAKKQYCIDPDGKEFSSIAEMCRAWGIPTYIFHNRVTRNGWSIEKALKEPVKKRKRN